MMVLYYCGYGNLRSYLNKFEDYIDYESKIDKLRQIARGLLDIHNAGKVHKDFHSGNILYNDGNCPYISDLGMCQPANKQTVKEEGVYGVLPYMAPEVLRGHQYTKSSDIYSFGIIMNEFLSEEIPYNDISHDEFLAIKICKGLRPKISKDVPKLLADLIIKCWDAEIENRLTAKELYQILNKWYNGEDSELNSQIKECDEIRGKKFYNKSNEDKSKNIQTHPQAIYTSRLLNFKNLPKPVNSSDLSSFQFNSGNQSIFIMKSTLQY
jgi:serine/threonine protein kinase